MVADDRTLSVSYSLSRWDLFWIGIRGLQPLLCCLVSYVAIVTMIVAGSYVRISYCRDFSDFILSNLFNVIVMTLFAYGGILIFSAGIAAWKGIKKGESHIDFEFSNRADGFFTKSSTGEGVFRWHGLKSVKIFYKALYVTTSDYRAYVVRARDVEPQSNFQVFADMAVERFKKAKKGL